MVPASATPSGHELSQQYQEVRQLRDAVERLLRPDKEVVGRVSNRACEPDGSSRINLRRGYQA
jgi:hypothetical protein